MTLVDGKLSPQHHAAAGRRHPLDVAAKRALDVVASSLMLIAATPFMLLAVAGIGLSSPGPVFYRARRVGKDGQLFSMLKFRSMRINSDALSAITAPGDSRIFPFGALIRKATIARFARTLSTMFAAGVPLVEALDSVAGACGNARKSSCTGADAAGPG